MSNNNNDDDDDHNDDNDIHNDDVTESSCTHADLLSNTAQPHLDERCGEPVVVVCLGQPVLHDWRHAS
jgi:hypothetical protein